MMSYYLRLIIFERGDLQEIVKIKKLKMEKLYSNKMKGFFTQFNQHGVEIDSVPWDYEKEEMQEFVMNNPTSIFQNLPPKTKITMIARELEIKSGKIDFVFVNEYGEFFIVETKLWENTDKKEIFAQVDYYAAATWNKLEIEKDVEGFFNTCQSSLQKYLKDTSLQLDTYLQEKLELETVDWLKSKIKDNIISHNITFVIVMDELDENIRMQIIYRQNKNIRTYGVELDQFKIDDKYLVVPKVFSVSPLSVGTSKDSGWIHDDNDSEPIFLTYEKYVNANQTMEPSLKDAITKLISKFREWNAYAWLNQNSKQIDIYFDKVDDGNSTPIIINPEGSISLRPNAFQKIPETFKNFRTDISEIDTYIQDKISSTKGMKIHTPQEIWVPKVNLILNILEKYCK